MKVNWKRPLTCTLCGLLLVGSCLLPRAQAADLDDLNSQYAELEQKIKNREKALKDTQASIAGSESTLDNLRGQITDLQEQSQVVSDKISLLNGQINGINHEIGQIDAAIEKLEGKIEQAKADIIAREEKQAQTIEQLLARLRAAYLAGNATWLETLTGAKDLASFLTRTEFLSRVAQEDQKLLKQLEREHEEIQEKQKELEADKKEQDKNRDIAAQKRDDLQKKKKDQSESAAVLAAKQGEMQTKSVRINNLISSLDADSDLAKKEIAKLEREQNDVEAQIEQAIRERGSKDNKEGNGDNSGESQSGTSSGSKKNMIFPVPYSGAYISANYGWYSPFGVTRQHGGTDICVSPSSYGKKIVAVKDGTVILANTNAYSSSYGKYIIIDHGNGIHTLYGHCSSLLVSEGQRVTQGQHIANIGATGRVTGAHLHFEVRIAQSNGSVERVNAIPKYISAP